MKEKIRPIYCEVQGYLSQDMGKDSFIFEETLWKQYNQAVLEINKITEKDYSKFLLKPISKEWNRNYRMCIEGNVYRSTVAGFINYLYGEYFKDERHPFSGTPSTIITTNQEQNQNQSIEMLFEFRDEIDKKIKEAEEGSKEKTFLEKLKESLSNIRSYSQLITLILKVGGDLGLTVQEITNLFIK